MHLSRSSSSRRLLVAGVVLAALTAGSAACGSSSGESASTTSAPPTTDVSAAAAFDGATEASLTEALDQAFATVKAPGAIVAVRRGDQTWTAVRGRTEKDGTTAPSLDDHTRVGSITKTFTGTLILQLVDEGKVTLDDPIDRWFPELPDGSQITIRMLGEHSSGIEGYTEDDALAASYFADPEQTWTPEELVAAGTALPRKFSPGEGFWYSNTNFIMLGMIVEDLTGMSVSDALQSMIFDPLELSQTSYPSDIDLSEPYWHGYTEQGATAGQTLDATNWSPTLAGAAGQIESDLDDVLTWAKAVGSGSLLEPETQQMRLEPNPASEKGPRFYGFGLGSDNGWLAHSGELPGYNSQIAYLPGEDITIVVLTNADIAGDAGNPAPTIFSALATAIAPQNAP